MSHSPRPARRVLAVAAATVTAVALLVGGAAGASAAPVIKSSVAKAPVIK